ncbi:hypothetical protein JTB14_035762 [Gonioctena quinquepunctata]|nr:hypothetical protein JTB14_035762 [Gonioctena quinquepunctata]
MVFNIARTKLLLQNARKVFAHTTISRYRHTTCIESTCTQNVIYMEPSCKIAVVTGGTDGIGFAIAHQLLCCKANHVVLIGLDIAKGLDAVNKLICAHGKSRSTFIKCDVTNKEAVDDTFKKIKNEFKTVDITVCSAGIWDERIWTKQLQTNLFGTINVNLAVQACFPNSGAVVVNISGISGLQPFPYSPIFATGCAGIVKLSQSLGHPDNHKRTDIRVVSLCTGITSTDIIKDVDQRMLNPDMGKALKEFLQEAPRQKPDAVAKAAMEVIKFGSSMSVWLVEGSRLLYLEMPDWSKNYCLVSQFT